MALYAPKLTTGQFATMLEEGVRRYSVTALPLETLVNEYLAHRQRRLERGSIGQTSLTMVKCISAKLVGYLGNPLVRDITTEMIDQMVDQRLTSTLKNGKKVSPRSGQNEVRQLSTLFKLGHRQKVHDR